MTEEKQMVPKHIAMIMDGNGRWAKARGQIRSAGHQAGAENIKTVIEACMKAGVQCLTLYAFSTENWKRSALEVGFLMRLIPRFCKKFLPMLQEHNIRFRTIGRKSDLPKAAQEALDELTAATASNTAFTVNMAVSYGGRAEILDAVNDILQDPSRKPGVPVTEEEFASHLYAPELPDPDLLIRTGGEKRISNFLLWEISYAELYVTDTLWPDFDKEALQQALDAYAHRDRRFGGVK